MLPVLVLDDDDQQNDQDQNLPCGFWCPRDPNEDPNTSHGICSDCAQHLKDQSDARQFQKGFPPSYISHRSAFYDYKEKKRR